VGVSVRRSAVAGLPQQVSEFRRRTILRRSKAPQSLCSTGAEDSEIRYFAERGSDRLAAIDAARIPTATTWLNGERPSYSPRSSQLGPRRTLKQRITERCAASSSRSLRTRSRIRQGADSIKRFRRKTDLPHRSHLGKETVQNIMFSCFDRRHLRAHLEPPRYNRSVQITNAETVGCRAPRRLLRQAGTLRAMVPKPRDAPVSLTAMNLQSRSADDRQTRSKPKCCIRCNQ